ncbi:BEN domain-containing protein 5-like [Triplophysa dalaica]|uniref:BEN domain-containing protein 5-like n=1 Tax=Triplophysa dalaica TaxID=1582913 RepID=UPI0024DF698D|nr:BEN domain-containing protein 5-like [Triplophysa dalaica]
MFAYVHYLDDGLKDSVNVKDIKHFGPKSTTDFSSTHTYWIHRKGRFATGQILFMKETSEEIEQFLATGKRIRVPKLLDKIPPANKTSERKEAKENATAQRSSIEEGKQTFLMDILKKRQALKRKQQQCQHHSKTRREKNLVDNEISSESEDELIPKSKYNELDKRYKLLSRKYQEAIAEGKELRKLNVELQTCLVAKILCGSNTSPTSIPDLPVTTGSNTSPVPIPDIPVTSESSPTKEKRKNLQTAVENSSAVVTYQNSEQILENQEVDIGEGVLIHSEKWKKIQANLKDSLFVKELAVCIWGTSTLANRSLEGKSCPTTKSDPRPPLTPHKYRAIKGCFQKWLEGKSLEEAELKARTGKVGRYLTEKIQDINKKIKSKK